MLAVFNIGSVHIANAIDIDGTANLDMTVNQTIDTQSIIGRNFALDISLSNETSSEDDGFNVWFIVVIPDGVSYVSSPGLWSPVRTEVRGDGSTMLFFETEDVLIRGTTNDYTLNLQSETDASLFTPTDINVLAYADDSIYGRWPVPSGSPGWTLPGGVDFAGSSVDPTDIDFPDAVNSSTNLWTLPFDSSTTEFIPFDVSKVWEDVHLIGTEQTSTVTIFGNDLWPLNNFQLIDIIPNSRKFVGFTATGWVWNIVVTYDSPNPWEVTLDMSDIDVPTGTNLQIEYTTLGLSHLATWYSSTGVVILDPLSPVDDSTPTSNTVTMQETGTWFDGTSTVAVDNQTLIAPKTWTPLLGFWELSKSVSNPTPILGETITYTLTLNAAQNTAFNTANTWSFLIDIMPDGQTFVSAVSSVNNWVGNALTFSGTSVNADGDTTIDWRLLSWEIDDGDTLVITYTALVDGIFEWAGDTEYENTESYTNTATFHWNVAESNNNEEYWFTEPSYIDTQFVYNASASITAPSPTNEKHLVEVEFPDGTIYNAWNPLPAGLAIPVDSKLVFSVSMDFPNVVSTGSIIKDALPLVAWPNINAYDIAFQTNTSLTDMDGNPVPFNDDDNDGNADSIFNTQTLGGTTPGDTPWITTTAPNNLEFSLGSWNQAKTFSVIFSVDLLPASPSAWWTASQIPQKNVMISSFQDDSWTINNLELQQVPFVIWLPLIELTKNVNPDPTTNIAFGDSITYDVVIQNTWDAAWYLENIEDILPDNLNLNSFSAVYSWSALTPVPGISVVQSWSTLQIDFNQDPALGRSILDLDDLWTATTDESTVIITYTLDTTVDFVIVWWEARINTVSLDYYSTGDAPSNDLNLIDTVSDTAQFIVDTPLITRDYVSTTESDSPDNQPWGRPDIHAWEESIFETIITLPPGTYTNASFTENLLTSRLNFISGSVISTWPDLSFSTGTWFISNVINFGDIVNSGTGDQTIVIQTTAIGRNDTTRRNNNRARWDFRYSWETITINTPVDLIIPTLIVSKDVTPAVADTADAIVYTIDIEHTGTSNATAYDILLKDVLPPNVTYVTGTLTWSTNYIWTEADLFSWSGIVFPSLIEGATETLSFEAQLGSWAVAGATERNNVDIEYSSLDDDGSPVEANYTAANFADLTVDDVEITHYITATNNSDTGSWAFGTGTLDLTIGEELTYNIDVDMPALVYSGVTVTQTLPPEFTFLTGSILVNGVASNSIETIIIGPDNTITFTFGDITNTGLLAGAWFTLETQVVVNDIPANGAWDLINSVAEVTYNWWDSKSDNSPNFDIVEPGVTITKTYSPDTWDGWDNILTTITITNPGTAPLYDVSWSDTLPPKSSGDGDYLASSSTGVLLPGQTISYTYNTILDSSVIYWEMLTGTASVMWDSMPWEEDEERDYTSSASDIITITGITGLMKDLTSSWSATVWDVESYIIMVPVSEWVTGNITVNDLIPAGMEVIPWTINISSSGGVSYSWTVTPTIGTSTVGNTQTVDYVFSDITNSDTNNSVTEYITIVYDAVVLNTSDVNDGDTKAEDVTVNYNSGATILNDGPVPVNIVEPNVSIDLSSTYSFGNDVVYTYTITNTWSSTAYDLDIDTLFPIGLTYSGAITITNSWWVVGIIQSWEDFTIEELPVNTGSPLQFTIAWIIDGIVDDMDDLTVNADITYTGQNDTYTSVVGNTDNTERTGTNVWENDYLDSDPDTITVLLPILNEDISVVDLNGWLGIINDTFEYTITLTNSGSVDLTDISALLDVPAGFTGFTLISFPSGSTNGSSATWWIDGAGQVDISDIDLLIGQSITIVYQVTALDTVPSPTTLTSEVIVSDTPEGAVGWNPDIDVTILAPDIQLTKYIDATAFNDPVVENDTITYGLIALNTWDVPLYNVVVNDPMLWGDITSSCTFPATGWVLAPTESAICNPSDYFLTTGDILRGYVENSADVEWEDESMNVVMDISDTGVGNEGTETPSGTGATDGDSTNDPTVQPLTQVPELTVTKVITATGFNIPNLVGDTITYEITIENTWNLAISWVTLTDPLLGWDITSSCNFPVSAAIWLDVDEVATCNPANYSIDVNDIIRWYVDNNATARWTDALGDPVSDISDPGDETTETPSGDGTTTDGNATNDPTTVEIIGEPELRVTKVISWTSLSTPTASGDTIDYTITIFNSWQLPVDAITLTDALLWGDITASCDFPISAADGLQVGESAICTPASYVINEADIVRDYVDNNATARGLDPNDDLVDDVSDPGDESTETPAGDGTTTDSNPTNDPTVQPLTPNPDWEIRKSTSSTPERVGETLEYIFELENTWNLTINTPTVTDEKCFTWPNHVATSDTWWDGRLSPNEIWTYTCTSIPVTQTEVDAGSVDNTVSADATTLLWTLPTATGATNTPIDAVPGWGIEKSTLSAPEFAGDTLDYTFVLTNTWNVSISGVNILDEKCDTSGIIRDDTTDINGDNILYQGEFWRYSCTSIPVTQTEVNDQSVINTVTATGSAARWTIDGIDDTLDTFIGRLSRIQLYKTATFNDENSDGEAEFGETISYNFTVRNTWNVDLSNVVVSDPLITVNGGPLPLLPVGWVDNTTFTGSYFILQPDVLAGYVENTATVLAQDIDGTDVTDISDAWDDTIETASGTGTTDSNPTNDPTVVSYLWLDPASSSSGWWGGWVSGPWRWTSTSSSGWRSGSSSSSSSSSSSTSSSSSSTSSTWWPIWISPSSSSGAWSSSSSGWGSNSVNSSIEEPISERAVEPSISWAQDEIGNIDQDSFIDSVKKYVADYDLRKDLYDRLIKESEIKWESLINSLPSVLPRTGTPIFERVNTILNPLVTTQLPEEETFRLAGTTNSDLNHWIQVLPDQDKDVGKYVVIPSNGLVMPINEFAQDSQDFEKMINGREWNINPVLESWALEYPGTSTKWYWEIGNKVIFGHSSYFSSSEWRYKTHFQKIIELDAGEQIWVYEKQVDGIYKRFVYVTEESYNTPDTDTSVLNPWVWKNLTLFTCTPIWGIEWRWIIKAKYVDEVVSELEKEVYFQDVSSEYKIRIQNILNIINTFSLEERLDIHVTAFNRIEILKPDYIDNVSVYRLLEFLQLRIAREILDIVS